jgi:hypothetical protein
MQVYRTSSCASTLAVEAEKLHEMGLAVIPVSEKKSLVKYGRFQQERPPRQTVRRWFSKSTYRGRVITGVGILLGSVSCGLRCRDFDTTAAYFDWAKRFPDLSHDLPQTRTYRGVHVFYQHDLPDETFPVNGTPPHRCGGRVKDGEHRGSPTSYVLAPPSSHPAGIVYNWLIPPVGGFPVVADPQAAGLAPPLSEFRRQLADGRTQTHQHGQHPNTQTNSCVLTPLPGDLEKAVLLSLPDGPGQRVACLFELAGRLLPFGLSDGEAEAVLRWWLELALPVIGTKDFAETAKDFGHARRNRVHPVGIGWQALLTEDVPVPEIADRLGISSGPMRKLLATIYRITRRDRTFFMGCRDAATAMGGVSHVTGWKALKRLQAAGVISLVKPGERGRVGGKAAEWEWIGG